MEAKITVEAPSNVIDGVIVSGPTEARVEAVRRLMLFEDIVAELDHSFAWIGDHACMTGDCPHESWKACHAELELLIRETAEKAQTLVAVAKRAKV